MEGDGVEGPLDCVGRNKAIHTLIIILTLCISFDV